MSAGLSRFLAVAAALLILRLTSVSGHAQIRDGGIDPWNLGKGDWIYILGNATAVLGCNVPSVHDLASLMSYEKSQGMSYLIIKAGTHPVFTRTGDDIYVTVPVTMTEAALGAKIDVPTIDTHEGGGRTQLKIPPGTQTGQKLRLREKGVPSAAHEGKRGDQIVEVKVVVPKLHDERSKEILRELAKLNPEEPRESLYAGV